MGLLMKKINSDYLKIISPIFIKYILVVFFFTLEETTEKIEIKYSLFKIPTKIHFCREIS